MIIVAMQQHLRRNTVRLNLRLLKNHCSDNMVTWIMYRVHYQCHRGWANVLSSRIMTLLSSSALRVDRRLCGTWPELTESISTGCGNESERTLACTSSTLALKSRLPTSSPRARSLPINGVASVDSRRLATNSHFARTIEALWQRYSRICYGGLLIGLQSLYY